MRKFRGVRYSLAILMVVNFIAVMLNSIIYLQATNYIIAQRQASLLVERLERIPFAPSTTFWLSALLFAGIALISMSRYRSQTSRWSIFDKWNILEIQAIPANKSADNQKVVEGAKGMRSKRSTNREACRWAMI